MNFSTLRKRPANKESKLQKACVHWFRYQYSRYAMLLFAIPNGGSRNPMEAARLKAEGVTSGVSDLFLSVPRNGYHGLYIEMKFGKNTMSENQNKFRKAVTEQGYDFALCYDFAQFQGAVENYFNSLK